MNEKKLIALILIIVGLIIISLGILLSFDFFETNNADDIIYEYKEELFTNEENGNIPLEIIFDNKYLFTDFVFSNNTDANDINIKITNITDSLLLKQDISLVIILDDETVEIPYTISELASDDFSYFTYRIEIDFSKIIGIEIR